MDSRKKHQMSIYKIISKCLYIIILFFILVIIIGHILFPDGLLPTLIEWLGIMFFPVGTVIGLILMWKRGKTGAIITIVTICLFYVWVISVKGRWGGPIPAVCMLPGILLLLDKSKRSR